MNRGYIKLYRKSLDSPIFAHQGQWKLFCLCLMKATHKPIEVTIPGILQPVKLKPGQFVTGRYALHRDYHQAGGGKRYSRKAAPTAYSLIRWLQNLEKMQILSIKTCNKYSIITVLNWDQYQEDEQQMSNRRASNEHKQTHINTNKKTPAEIFERISTLKYRYPNPNLIDSAIEALASTRKSNQIANKVVLAQLEKWAKYPSQQVEMAIQTYLEKNYADHGKREEYLLGIIRNGKPQSAASPHHAGGISQRRLFDFENRYVEETK